MKLSVVGFAVACLLVAGSAFASTGEELAASCTGCHSGVMARPLADVAAGLKAEEDKGKARIITAITEGATVEIDGAQKTMPKQASVSAEDAATIADWMLTL